MRLQCICFSSDEIWFWYRKSVHAFIFLIPGQNLSHETKVQLTLFLVSSFVKTELLKFLFKIGTVVLFFAQEGHPAVKVPSTSLIHVPISPCQSTVHTNFRGKAGYTWSH